MRDLPDSLKTELKEKQIAVEKKPKEELRKKLKMYLSKKMFMLNWRKKRFNHLLVSPKRSQ